MKLSQMITTLSLGMALTLPSAFAQWGQQGNAREIQSLAQIAVEMQQSVAYDTNPAIATVKSYLGRLASDTRLYSFCLTGFDGINGGINNCGQYTTRINTLRDQIGSYIQRLGAELPRVDYQRYSLVHQKFSALQQTFYRLGNPQVPYPGNPYPGNPYPGNPYPGNPYPGNPYPGNTADTHAMVNELSSLAGAIRYNQRISYQGQTAAQNMVAFAGQYSFCTTGVDPTNSRYWDARRDCGGEASLLQSIRGQLSQLEAESRYLNDYTLTAQLQRARAAVDRVAYRY